MINHLPILYDFEQHKIRSHNPVGNSCGLWQNEKEVLIYSAMISPIGHSFVEIGSHNGASALLLGLVRQHQNRGPKLFTVDINYGSYFNENISNGRLWNIVRKIEGTSRTFKELVKDHISFAFIDGFHSFKWVVEDFENIQENLVDDSIVCFHDTSPILYSSNNNSYIKSCLESAEKNFQKWMEDESQNFLVDEAICYLAHQHNMEFIDIPVRRWEFYPRETGLQKWERGTTSPNNSLVALRYKKCSHQ